MVFGWGGGEEERRVLDPRPQRNGVNSDGVGVETAQEVQPEVFPPRLRDVDVEKQLIDAVAILVPVVTAAAGDDVGQSHDGDGDLFVVAV